MRRLTLILAMLFASDTVLADAIAIVNVNVIPMSAERVLPAQTVVVENGIILAIGDVDVTPIPEAAKLIDGTDRYLLPGLVEMHAHVTSTNDSERLFKLFLANGVTTIRGMLGRRSHLQLRDSIAAGTLFGPRLITSGPSFNGNSVNSVGKAERMVREQFAAGYDFLKVHPGLSRDEFDAMANTANELGIPFAGHVPVAVGLEHALDRGMATIDHFDGYLAAMLPSNSDSSGGYGGFFDVMLADQVVASRLDELVTATVAAGVANVPTESLFEQFVNSTPASELGRMDGTEYVSKATRKEWAQSKQYTLAERGFRPEVAAQAIGIRRHLILALHEAGGSLLLGSDAPQIFNVPGFSLHNELAFMVAAGLTPFEALRTGTVAPAAFFGIETGTVEVGKIADLLLLDANPLLDIANSRRIHGVLARGRWYSAADLLADL